MNLYDFDKTIYKNDCSYKFYFYCFFRTPKMFFHIFKVFFYGFLFALGIIETKFFKEKFFSFLKYIPNPENMIESFWKKELKNINKYYYDTKQDSDVICSASPKFLVEFAMKQINENATVIGTEMDINTGKISGENMKGEVKRETLTSLGYEKFDNVYTDSFSDFPILDMTENKKIVCGKNVYNFGEQKPTFGTKIKYIIKQLRVKHYIKNLLIAFPLFFSGLILDLNSIWKSLVGIVAFSLMSSFVYVLNDLFDVKNDRKHNKKRKRPIACYMIKIPEAICLAVVLFAVSVAITLFAFDNFLLPLIIIVGYGILNLLYSTWLKKLPIVDIFVLSSFYLIRLYYGAFILSVSISKWLYLTVLCGALYMGFGKRRNEVKKEGDETRAVNKVYSYNFLDKNLYVCLALCLVFYSLWAIDIRSTDWMFLNGKLLLITIPLVYFIIMRYSFNIEKSSNSGDPIDVLLKDWVLILAVVAFIALLAVSIYIPIRNFLA